MSSIVLATYLVQATCSAITAAVLLRFWGIYRREYLRLWAWSWVALAVYQAAAGTAFSLSMVIGEPDHPLRVLASTLALAATGGHIIWLVQGARAMLRPVDPPPSRGRRVILFSALGISLLAVLIITLTMPMELDSRRLARAWVHSIASAAAYAWVAALLLRRSATARGLGTRMLAFGSLTYAASQLASLGLFIYDTAYADQLPLAEYAGLFNGLVQVVMSLGVVIWLVDDERSRTEQTAAALAQSQLRLRDIIDDVRLIAWEFDPHHSRFTFVSPQAEHILGYSIEEWLEPSFWFNHVHPDDRDRARAYSHEQSARGVGHEYEYRMLRKDGGSVWFRDLTSVVHRGGEVESLHGVLIDVTARREAESALAASEERLRGLFESAVDPLWDWDIRADRTNFSPSWPRLLEYPPDEFARTRPQWQDLLHPDDRPAVLARLREAQEHPSRRYEVEYRLRTHGGEWKWVLSRGQVVSRDDSGRATRMVGSIADIAERKRAENALRDSEARYRAVVEDQTELICRFLPDGSITFANDAYCRYFGLAREDAAGRSVFSLMSESDAQRQREMMARLTPDSPAETIEVRSTGPDGAERWRQWIDRALFDASGRIREMQAVGRDVTAERVAEQALERSNELQRLLLSELDHRVRNNLASLTALIDISSRDSRSVRDFAASIRSRVHAMTVVHAMLSHEHWRSVDLEQLILTLAPVGAKDLVQMRGPAVAIAPRQATALGMVLQELLANSQKYGSLASPGGMIDLGWSVEAVNGEAPPARRLNLHWRERGGPAIVASVREGVGTGLVQGLVRAELRGEAALTFPRSGAAHDLTFLLDGTE